MDGARVEVDFDEARHLYCRPVGTATHVESAHVGEAAGERDDQLFESAFEEEVGCKVFVLATGEVSLDCCLPREAEVHQLRHREFSIATQERPTRSCLLAELHPVLLR